MTPTNEQHSIAEARSNLEDLVHKVEEGEAVELTREGERVAVLLGWREYAQLTGRPRKNFWEALQEFRRSADFKEVDINPDEVFGDVRDPDPGRDVDL